MSSKMVMLGIIWMIAHVCLSQYVDYDDVENWGESCEGIRQSPVDLSYRAVKTCPPNIWFQLVQTLDKEFPYQEKGQDLKVQAENINYIAQASQKANTQEITLDIYSSLQFHYHTPSQHTIDGQYFDLQLHLVHLRVEQSQIQQKIVADIESHFSHNLRGKIQPSVNNLAVIGLLFDVQDVDQDIFDTFIPVNEKGQIQGSANIQKLLADVEDYFFFHYEGSLTVPSCRQVVNWFVLRKPLPIRAQNYRKFKSRINNGKPNNRPINPLNNRPLYLVSNKICPFYQASLLQ